MILTFAMSNYICSCVLRVIQLKTCSKTAHPSPRSALAYSNPRFYLLRFYPALFWKCQKCHYCNSSLSRLNHTCIIELIVVLFTQEEENADDKLVLHLKTRLQPGVPFVWDFHCSSTEEQMVNDLGSDQMPNFT